MCEIDMRICTLRFTCLNQFKTNKEGKKIKSSIDKQQRALHNNQRYFDLQKFNITFLRYKRAVLFMEYVTLTTVTKIAAALITYNHSMFIFCQVCREDHCITPPGSARNE